MNFSCLRAACNELPGCHPVQPTGRCAQHPRLLAVLFVLTGLLAGCATNPGSPRSSTHQAGYQSGYKSGQSNPQAQIDQVAAEDLVFALAQALPPKLTTVQIGPAVTPFAKKLVDEIINTGFGVQRVSADQGPRHLYFTQMERDADGAQAQQQYLIHVGKNGFERAYAQTDTGEVVPATPLHAYGIDEKITLHPELFVLSVAGQKHQSVLYINDSNTSFTPPRQGVIMSLRRKS